jgi:hypothetical protein
MNEIGLDPGIDHLSAHISILLVIGLTTFRYAVDFIERVHAQGGKITSFKSFCKHFPLNVV